MTKSKGVNKAKYVWHPEVQQLFVMLYPDISTKELAEAMGISLSCAYSKADALGLKKSAAYMASDKSGRIQRGRSDPRMVSTQFKKGQTSWNKGSKGLMLGGVETQFKKGDMPHNTLEVGSYRITKDGTLQRKISNDKGSNSKRWRGVHELVWIEANGPVPEKHIVVFKPGMRSQKLEEITLDKVECLSLSENMQRNTYHNRYPKEICRVIQLKGAIKRQINKREKHHEQNNQRPA